MTNLDNILESRDITLPTKVHPIKAMIFSSSHVWMWELDYKESWAPKNWCFWTVMLEKTLESPLDCKEIQPVHPKGDKSWIFIGRTDVEAETPILCPPDAKSWLIWKDPVTGKDWRQEEKETTEDEMVGWHQWLNGHKFEQDLGVGTGQGSLACCSPRGHKELGMTKWLNWCNSDCLFISHFFYDLFIHFQLRIHVFQIGLTSPLHIYTEYQPIKCSEGHWVDEEGNSSKNVDWKKNCTA